MILSSALLTILEFDTKPIYITITHPDMRNLGICNRDIKDTKKLRLKYFKM